MQTSGAILDVYDDIGGEVLRSMFPESSQIPGFIKQAHALTVEERSQLPDDVFALVLVNDDYKLRKYACIDEGNTTLSVLYFLKHAHKLPPEARKTAAENLKIACGWYGLDVPVELEKEAGVVGAIAELPARVALRHAAKNPVGTAMTVMSAPEVVKGTTSAIKQNLANVNMGERMAGAQGALASMAGPHGLHHLMKQSEVSGTDTAPISADASKKTSPSLSTIRKTAHLRPVVDVTGKEPVRLVTEKKASHYALGDKYPINNYAQVKLANDYFAEYGRKLSPAERHEYCSNLVKRASELCIPLDDIVRKYGSDKYAAAHEVEMALDTRRLLVDGELRNMLDKIAHVRPVVPPEDFVVLLSEFDKVAGIDDRYNAEVMDPFYSTYGFTKTSEDENEEFSDVVGNYYVTAADLKRLRSNKLGLKHTFGHDFCDEFCKDPVSIYKSLPVDQKKLVIRMATENSPV